MAGLGDIGDFIEGLTRDFASAFKAVKSPSSIPVSGVPTTRPETGMPTAQFARGGFSTSTLLLVGAVLVLGTAFFFSTRK